MGNASQIADKVAILGVGATRAGFHPGVNADQLAMQAFKGAARLRRRAR